jgi:hypothetical protein
MKSSTVAALAIAGALTVSSVAGGYALSQHSQHPTTKIVHVADPAPAKPAPAVIKPAAPAAKSPSTNITINNNPAPAAPAPAAAAPAAPAAWTNCNANTAYFILANQNTSCPFAMNVATAVQQNGYGTSYVSSPVTGQTYAMTAEPVTGPDGGTAVMVTGGNNAAVELYVTTLNGDQPPAMP